jgi:glycosyltransferase involved in cell wall biosynthesis
MLAPPGVVPRLIRRGSVGEACSITVLFPCLNEEAAIGECVDRALAALAKTGETGEVLVVDNASTDRSAEIAREHGARVVTETRRGYGSAYLRGLQEARGEYVVMLDADGTYPTEMLADFVKPLREGADLVVGNRFGGLMESGAMPLMNRYVGNPILSGLTRVLFGIGLTDIHCGMRAFKRQRVMETDLRMPGMEFATEMIVKALDADLVVREVGIPYRPRVGESKLSPVRDAWRHIEYMLIFSPTLLFLLPGLLLAAFGLFIQLWLVTGPRSFWFRTWNVHTNVAGLAAALFGFTLFTFGMITAGYAWATGMRFRHSRLARAIAEGAQVPARYAGLVFTLTGLTWWLVLVFQWAASGFGTFAEVPALSLATTLLTGGLELIGAAFIMHLIGLTK